MATAAKHQQRSQRSKRNKVDFRGFYQRASVKETLKAQRMSIGEMIKSLFHRTASK